MSSSLNDAVGQLVARFFEDRTSGRRESVDLMLDGLEIDPADRAAVRNEALRRISSQSRLRPGSRGCARDADSPVPPAATEVELPELDGYYLVDRVGHGGMGVVYEGYQQATGRRVAVKFMLDAAASTESARRRFEREVELAARLQHPKIVSVLDSGILRGRYYYVMEYVEGRPLDEAAVPGKCAVEDALRLVAAICGAVDYAHQRGVLHRDLKPANILVDPAGMPHILDFGLAKAIDPASPDSLQMTLSQPGQMLGTLAYMSPEQSLGRWKQTSIRSDVYSLGVIAYELATGCLPCGVDGPLGTALDRIAHNDPARPSSIRHRLSADVDAILLKALEKCPEARYATAGALAEDIRRHLNHETIVARRASWATHMVRWTRRNRRVAIVGAVAAVLVVIIAANAFVRVRDERDRARSAERVAAQEAAAAERVSDYLTAMLEDIDPAKSSGRQTTLEEVLDKGLARVGELKEDPVAQAKVLYAIGSVYRNMGLLDGAEPVLQQALTIRRREFGDNDPDVGHTLNILGGLYQMRGDLTHAEPLYREALEVFENSQEPRFVAVTLQNLGDLLHERLMFDEAEPYYRRSLSIRRELFGDNHAEVAMALHGLGATARERHRFQEAESRLMEAVAIYQGSFGKENFWAGLCLYDLALTFYLDGNRSAAEETCRQSLDMLQRTLPPRHPKNAEPMVLLGALLVERGDAEAAETLLRKAVAIRSSSLSPGNWLTAQAESTLGGCLTKLARYDEAEPLVLNSYRILGENLPAGHRDVSDALQRIIDHYHARGQPERAASWRAKLRASESTAP